MALLDAAVTAVEYHARTSAKGDPDGELDPQLKSATRLLERSLRVMPGAWNTHTGTYIFDAHGGSLLRLRDTTGLRYYLRTITADSLGLDTEQDGTYDGYSLDLDDAWVRGLPENAASFSEPFHSLQILSHLSTASPALWPTQVASVRIAGTWGWAAVPGPIKELVTNIVQDLRSGHLAGAGLDVPIIDEAMGLSPKPWRLWLEMREQYSEKLPGVA